MSGYLKTNWHSPSLDHESEPAPGAPALTPANINKMERGIESGLGVSLTDLANAETLGYIYSVRVRDAHQPIDAWYNWISDSDATPNNATIIQPVGHVGNGRWHVVSDLIDVRLFGARSVDGHDNSDAIQAALDAAPEYSVVYIPERYGISKGVQLKNKRRIKIIGRSKFVSEIYPLADFDRVNYDYLLEIGDGSTNTSNIVLSDISCLSVYNNSGDNVSGLSINAYYNIDVFNCEFKGGNPVTRQTGGVVIKRGLHTRFLMCNFHNGYGYGALIKTHTNDLWLDLCSFDETQASIVTEGNVTSLNITRCSFGGLSNNNIYPASVKKTHIDLSIGAHGNIRISDNDVLSNVHVDYGVITNHANQLTIQSNKFVGQKRFSVVHLGTLNTTLALNEYRDVGSAKTTDDVTQCTGDYKTSPWCGDFYLRRCGGGAISIVGERSNATARAMFWAEGDVGNLHLSTIEMAGAACKGGLGYIRGKLIQTGIFSEGKSGAYSVATATVSLPEFTVSGNGRYIQNVNMSGLLADHTFAVGIPATLLAGLVVNVVFLQIGTARVVITNTTSSAMTQPAIDVVINAIS